VALAGIGLAFFALREAARSVRRDGGAVPGVHRLLLNKYYVDELYDAAIVQPINRLSQDGLWRGMDVQVVDGAVNGAGSGGGRAERRTAAPADRIGAHLRRVHLPRRRGDPRLLPLEIRTP
jgi:NADH-quinone oxidoreductase subunit L